jgi:[ribosomal protein S5]-alanine N-acetyltransferase
LNENCVPTTYGMIRPWSRRDADSLATHANNRNVWINLRDGFPHPYTPEDARAFLAGVSRQKPVTFFAIATAREAIGGIGVSLGTDVHRRTAELGYWLAEPYWGRGIMTETVTAFTAFVFTRFDVVRIHAEPFATNRGSCRVLEKAGYMAEGRMRCNVLKDGKILDQWLYAMVKDGP